MYNFRHICFVTPQPVSFLSWKLSIYAQMDQNNQDIEIGPKKVFFCIIGYFGLLLALIGSSVKGDGYGAIIWNNCYQSSTTRIVHVWGAPKWLR